MDRNLVVLAGGIASRMRASAVRGHPRHDADLLREAKEKPKAMLGVGPQKRPFLDFLLMNARDGGVESVLIVVGASDTTIMDRYGQRDASPIPDLHIGFARQSIPEGRSKPLGTADALMRALDARPEWRGSTCLVCNSDNLYSAAAFQALLESPCRNALIDYERASLHFEDSTIARFALILKDEEGFVTDIEEKPDSSRLGALQAQGITPGVSMNIYRLETDLIYPFLLTVPPDPIRGEKELPTAVALMVRAHPRAVCAIHLSEHVPDLTQLDDIPEVQRYLDSTPT